MNSKYLIIAIIVIAVLAGGFFLIKGQYGNSGSGGNLSEIPNQATVTPETSGNAAPTASQDTKAVTVEYTGSGFVPNTITVKTGTTVTWVNKDADPLWVASNPHPTHTDLPGFDELKSIPTGGTFSYTFTKTGKWGYHNHMNPSNKGTVVVEQ